MFTSLEMLQKANAVVYQSPILIHTSVVCGELEAAGIPAVLGQSREAFTILVPAEYTAEAEGVLNPLKS